MNLPNNIIKELLKNVYFVAGTACGGKSTISKYLADKYDFYLYDTDKLYEDHKKMSDSRYQSEMNMKYSSWYEYFGRNPEDYAESVQKSIHEQSEITILELIKIASDKKVVVDGFYTPAQLAGITDKNRVVFLLSDIECIKQDYLHRENKADMRKLLDNLNNSDILMANLFKTLELLSEKERTEAVNSNFTYFERTSDTDWVLTRQSIEEHFGLQ